MEMCSKFISGTAINYYFICHRKLYLYYHNLCYEDNSENVLIGKILHDNRYDKTDKKTIQFDGIKIDKVEGDYVVEYKKSDSHLESAEMQLLYYLYKLKERGVHKKGKIIFHEKKKSKLAGNKKTVEVELSSKKESELKKVFDNINNIIEEEKPPSIINSKICKKCAYFEFCYA